ncbi:MAG: RNHCP domain-containing protein [Patescibacteria group bacterium]|jgi:hypothetical protein
MKTGQNTKQFQRKIEDFVCARCGAKVKGSGYTNHCPECFTSKHVDEQPGDRAATCGGLMPPVHVFFSNKRWVITQQCELCGQHRNNRVQVGDNMEKLAALAKQLAIGYTAQ